MLALSVLFGLYPCFFLFYGFHSGFHLVLAQCFLGSVKVSGDATEYFVLVCQLADPITHPGGFGTLPAEPLLQPVIIVSQTQKCVVDGAENLDDLFKQRLGFLFPVAFCGFQCAGFRKYLLRVIGELSGQLLHVFDCRGQFLHSVSGFLCFELGSFLLIFQIVDLCFRYGLCCLQTGKSLLFGLHLKLGHGQMFLGAATLPSFHIGVTGSSHEVEELILEDTVRGSEYLLSGLG